MSTVKANDLQNTSGGIPTVKGQNLIPTAWVHFHGANMTTYDSEGVSSLTDNGVGYYTINFTTAMSSSNGYMALQCPADIGDSNGNLRHWSHTATSYTTKTVYSNGGAYDWNYVALAFMGGQ